MNSDAVFFPFHIALAVRACYIAVAVDAVITTPLLSFFYFFFFKFLIIWKKEKSSLHFHSIWRLASIYKYTFGRLIHIILPFFCEFNALAMQPNEWDDACRSHRQTNPSVLPQLFNLDVWHLKWLKPKHFRYDCV